MGKNSTFSGEVQAKVKGFEKVEGLQQHMSTFFRKPIPVIVLGDHLGVEETVLRSKPPSDGTLSPYISWLREWVVRPHRYTGFCPTDLMLADCLTKRMSTKLLEEVISEGILTLPLCMSNGQLPPTGMNWEKY